MPKLNFERVNFEIIDKVAFAGRFYVVNTAICSR